MGEKLKPTLWRTARALANADRLNLMRLVSCAKGSKKVKEIAQEADLAVPTASIYLRALNARGLISVVRSASCVYYGTGSDRSLPVAMDIQEAFRKLFRRKKLPADWTDRLLPVLRSYCSPRREALLRILVESGPMTYSGLLAGSGISETSFLRHLGNLLSSGIVRRDGDGCYFAAKPRNSLEAVFLNWVSPPHL